MACINMVNNDQQQQGLYTSSVDSRISFSNDFGDTHQAIKYKEAPASSDFEFIVENYSLVPADEVFFKGRVLPLKDQTRKPTLRDELLNGLDDDEFDGSVFSKASSNSGWWKEKFGLKRSGVQINVRNKRSERSNGVLECVVEGKMSDFKEI